MWITVCLTLIASYLVSISGLESTAEDHTCEPLYAISRETNRYYKDYHYLVKDEDLQATKEKGEDIQTFPRFFDTLRQKCLSKLDNYGQCSEADDDCPTDSLCYKPAGGETHWSDEFLGDCPNGFPCEDHPNFKNYYDKPNETLQIRYPMLGNCYCLKEFNIPNSEGTMCIPDPFFARFGEFCNDTTECKEANVHCQNNKCVCHEDNMEYNAGRKMCVGLVNFDCTDSSDICGDNFECSYSGRRGQWKKTCKCPSGYEEINGQCFTGHLGHCKKLSDCRPNQSLKCIEGFCKCEDVVNQFYDTENSRCRSLVGGQCLENGDCTNDAICSDGFCECSSLFQSIPGGKCESLLPGFGAKCDVKGCDFRKGLGCVDGVCECISSKYNEKHEACLTQLGSPCGKVEPVGDDPSKNSYFIIGCEAGSLCKSVEFEDFRKCQRN